MRAALPVASRAQVLRYARSLLRAHPRTIRIMVGLHLLAALAGVAGPPLLGELVQAVHRGTDAAELNRIAVVLAGVVLVQAVLTRFAYLASTRFGERVLAELREEFVTRVLAMPLNRVESAGTGDLLTRATRDVGALSKSVRLAVPETMIALLTGALVVVALIAVSPVLAAPLLIGVPIIISGTRWYVRRAPDGYLRQNAAYSEVTDGLSETVRGARTVEALGRQKHRITHTDRDLGQSWRAERYTLFLRTVWWPVVEISYVLPLVFTLVLGGWLYMRGVVNLGQLTAAVVYVQQLINPLDRLLSWLDELQVGAASLARLLGVTAMPEPSRPAAPSPVGTQIEVRGVRFGYTGAREVLHGVDLALRPGERLAVVGPSGAGKSTLGRLLAGIHQPTEGSVTVGGVPLDTLAPDRLRAEVALVSQEHHVFIGTLRDNVAMVRPAAAEPEVWSALAAVRALDWVNELPGRLDTVVGDGGYPLTGAQAQQVALARLILADPHTLVLDEATALLDPRAARDVERSLAAVMHGRTVVTISQRLFSAHDADRIAVVEHGRITELGSHDELVSANGSYARIWRAWHGEPTLDEPLQILDEIEGMTWSALGSAMAGNPLWPDLSSDGPAERLPRSGGTATATRDGSDAGTNPPSDLPPTPSPDPQRYLVGTFPSHAGLMSDISLTVRITTQPSDARYARTKPLRPPVRLGGTEVSVIVEPSAALAAHTPMEQAIHVPLEGDSDPIRFIFRAQTEDLHRLRLTAWAGGTFLAELDFQVSATAAGSEAGTQVKDAVIDKVQANAGEVTLQVRRDRDRFTFQLLSNIQMFDPVIVESLSSGPDLATEQIIKTLQQLARGSAQYSPRNARKLMQNMGISLWSNLVPETIQEQFWQLRPGINSFSVATGLDTIPWELLYPMTKRDDAGFLIEQMPVTRRVYNQPRASRINLDGARFVVSEDSPRNAEAEIASLCRIVAGGGDPLVVSQLGDLLELLDSEQLGLVHFTCHNTYRSGTEGSSIVMDGGPFVPALLARARKMESLANRQPLIFINACRSAGAVPQYTRMMGWAQQFLAAGAGAFVGTLWDVRSTSAQKFAEAFYSYLMDGLTLGQASLQARTLMARNSDDPTWLAYSVYGDPYATPVRD